MQTKPLFVASWDELLANLRLSGLGDKPSSDASQLLEQALQAAIVRFYSELTADKIGELQGTEYKVQPTTKAEAVRMLANLTEIRLVKIEALRVLPVRFLDGIATVRQDWNEEAPLYDAGDEKARMIAELASMVEDAFGVLSGDTDLSDAVQTKIKAGTIGPSSPHFTGSVALPGGTIFPYLNTNPYLPVKDGEGS